MTAADARPCRHCRLPVENHMYGMAYVEGSAEPPKQVRMCSPGTLYEPADPPASGAGEPRPFTASEALDSALAEMSQATHYAHLDPKGTAGANCPACHAMIRARDHIKAARAALKEGE